MNENKLRMTRAEWEKEIEKGHYPPNDWQCPFCGAYSLNPLTHIKKHRVRRDLVQHYLQEGVKGNE